MALFCSSFNPPSVSPKIPRNSAIQRPLRLKTSIPVKPYFEIPKISISAPTKTLNNKPKYRSILNSHVELEQEPPTSVIIFVKGTTFGWDDNFELLFFLLISVLFLVLLKSFICNSYL